MDDLKKDNSEYENIEQPIQEPEVKSSNQDEKENIKIDSFEDSTTEKSNIEDIKENPSYKDSFTKNSSYNFGTNASNVDVRTASYYTENHKKKTRKKNFTIVQLIAVAVACSVLSGGVVGGMFILAAPIVQPAVQKIAGNYVSQDSSSYQDNGIYKKVEIEKSSSPVSAVAEKVGPSIIGIRVTSKASNSLFNIGSTGGTSEGSGIIIRSDGYIMTNYHVIQTAVEAKQGATVEVILPKMKDKPYVAKIIGTDWRTDLAVLKIEADNLPAVEFGDSDALKVGELAIAIGNPAGMELMGSVTTGIISGLDRTIPLEDIKDLKLIQTDASINPGNSGGALVNSEGKVIGVNNAKLGGDGYEGLGFAIPINKAKEVTDSLIEYKYVKGRPLLGITVDGRFTEEYAKQYNVPAGVLVADVHPLSGAYKAGIQVGDIITKVEGKVIKDKTELDSIKNKKKPGDSLNIEIYRDGKTKTMQVILSEDTGNN